MRFADTNAGCEDGGRGPKPRNVGKAAQEAEKENGNNTLHRSSTRKHLCQNLTLAQWNWF